MLTPRLRALGVVASAMRAPRSDVSRLAFRVWPTDVDLNVHLTNSRFLNFMDLGRLDWLVRAGLGKGITREGYRPMAVHVGVDFRRELGLMQRFTLETRITGRQRKAVVFTQRFLVGEREHAVGTVHVLTVRGGKVVEPTEWFGDLAPAPDQVQGSRERADQ